MSNAAKRFPGAEEARRVDVGALGAAMSTMRGGFSALGGDGLPCAEPVHFSPAPGPKHFKPADPSANPTAGWNPFDPLDARTEKPAEPEPQPAIDAIEAARAEGFAEGMGAAEKMTAAAIRDNLDAMERLGAALDRAGGLDREALAARLRQTVLYLVTRLVGEAGVSADLLSARIDAAVQLLADTTEPVALRLNPEDYALVHGRFGGRIAASADAGIERGGFRIETRSTLIEDGPSAWLTQLAAAIDRAPLPDAA